MALDMGLLVDGVSISFTDAVDAIVEGNGYQPKPGPDDVEWITETVRMTLVGGLVNIRDTISKIERGLTIAKTYHDAGEYSVVQLYGRLDGGESYYYSDVREGYLQTPNYDQISANQLEITLVVEHRNYWVGAPITLTQNRNAESTPFEISAVNDGLSTGHGARYNWLEVNRSLTAIPGDLPAFAKIVLGPSGATMNMGRLYIFQGVGSSAGPDQYTAEGDTPGTAAGNTYSGAAYYRMTLGAAYDSLREGPYAYGGITSQLGFMARFAPTRPAVAVDYQLATSQWSTEVKRAVLSNQLALLDAIPPSPTIRLSPTPEEVTLYLKSADGSSQTLDVDFLAAVPMDRWMVGDVMGGPDRVTYDGGSRQRQFYISAVDLTVDTKVYRGWEGPGIQFYPGKINRLYFFWDRSDRTFNADDYILASSIQAIPRRRML